MTKIYLTARTDLSQLAEDVAQSTASHEDLFNFIVEIDEKIMEYEFTEALYKYLKKIIKDEKKAEKAARKKEDKR